MDTITPLHIKPILNEMDVVLVRQLVKDNTAKLKFSITEQTKLTTAASEIARNTLKYGGGGTMTLSLIENEKQGLQLVFEDKGPGIADIEQALQNGFTSGNGMGLGLGGAQRLVSEFHITSKPGKGTTVILIKWNK